MGLWKNKHLLRVNKVLTCILLLCPVYISAQTFPACDGRLYYFAENATNLTLTYIDKYTTNNTLVSTVVCNLSTNISTKANALGANPVDNFLYFIEKDDVSGDVVIRKLKSNCNAPIVCPASNVPAIPFAKAACFDTLGRYWVLDGTQLSAWDLSTCTIVKGPFTLTSPSNDLVFNPWDCCLYSGGNKIDLNGNVTSVSGSSINGPGFAMGSDGKVYAIQGGSADSMELTRYDLVTGIKATVGYIKPGSVNGSDMASNPCAILTAKFIASPPTCPPSAITFTDQSTGIISNWNWDFGDGNTSTLQNPSHTFTSSGTYTVKLTVSATNSCIVVAPSTYTLSLTVPSTPTVTLAPAAICMGKSTTLTPGGASTYTWAPATGLSSSTGGSVTANPSATTTYTLTGTNVAGCSNTVTAVVTVNPNPTVSVPAASICTGASTTLTASGANTYTWTPATGLSTTTGTSVTANPTATTTYTITGSNPTGCTGTSSVIVTVSPSPITVAPATICQGNSAGLTASGANTYTWAPATGLSATTGTSVTATPSATITYTVTGTAVGGCTGSTTVIVTVNPPCGTGVAAVGSTICEGACGTAMATASGGAAPYTYLWNTGATSSGITVCPLVTTTYTVTATDNNGAGISASAIAVITVNPSPAVTVPAITLCAGTSTTLNASGASTYTWSPATGLSATTGTSVTASPSATTTYTVTGTDLNGCTGITTVIVTVNPVPVISVPNATICPGGSTTLNATGASTYVWSAATGLSATTGASVTASPATTTTYTITGTDAGCTASTTVVVTVGALIADAGPDAAICLGSSTQLNASGGTLFTWTPATGLSNATIGNPVASPAITTTYTVTVSDGSCSDDDVVVITVNPLTTLNAAGINVTCNGACNGQIIVIPSGGTSPYTYNWSTGCSAAACSGICPGTYTIITTDIAGCTASATATVTEPPALTASVTGQTNVSCFGLCDGTAAVSANGGTVQYTYSWNSSPVQTSANATGLCAGTYTCTVMDANNCSVNTSVTITQPAAVVVTSANANICPGTCATLHANGSGGTGTIGYSWNLGVTTAAVSVCPAATTTYTVTGTDANGCSAATSVIVTLNPVPVIAVPGASICQGTVTTLTASGASTYSWSPLTGLSSGAGTTVTAGPSATTTYTVTGTNSFGCTDTTLVVVTVNIAPVITPNPASMCPGDSVVLTASGADTYTWSPALGLSSSTGSLVIARPTATSAYTITGTGTNGCTSSIIATVTVYPKPVAGFSTSPDPVSVFNPTVYFTDHSTGATTWNWSFGDLNHTGSLFQNPVFIYPDTVGQYTIQLIVTNQYGCIDTTESQVYIKGEYTFFIPNTFTPNGDGTNDGFSPKGTGIDETDYDLWVFDRWGNLIWHTGTWGQAWDGRANGGIDIAQIDTYVWKVHVRENDSKLTHDYIGHVNIVK